MPGQSKNGMQCSEFEALLSDALDEQLTGVALAGFQAHAQACAVCGPLLAEVQAGQRWLTSLEEVDPPADLVRNIVLATSGVQPSRWERFSSNFLAPVVAVARQPRFAMSFGMAFFSLSVALNVAGVRLGDVRRIDLRPSAVKRQYYETKGRIQARYENMRVVYEMEARFRELKRATTPAQPEHKPEQQEHKNNTSGQPDQNQQRNYSQGENQPVLAAAPDDPPVVKVTTYRRFV